MRREDLCTQQVMGTVGKNGVLKDAERTRQSGDKCCPVSDVSIQLYLRIWPENVVCGSWALMQCLLDGWTAVLDTAKTSPLL